MSETKIIKCSCNHEFQDKEYGKNMRVHNLRDQKLHKGEAVCTVCGKTNSLS